uniref:UTRA domain-containing protein n=1 Tax=Halomonas sp. TaxID=1486246 RepID=UPI002635806A|nr:UTRA domain-containing protein [Halomonas sp.]
MNRSSSVTKTPSPRVNRLLALLLPLVESAAQRSDRRLPAEREMMAHLATTRITLREALIQLEAQGRIYRENRRGWFVSPPRLRYDLLACLPFHEMVRSQQRRAETLLLTAEEVEAPADVARRLGLSQGERIYRIIRTRLVDGRRVLYVEHHLRPDCFPGILNFDLAKESLTELYSRHYGIRVGRVSYELATTVLSEQAASALNTVRGSPVQRVTRVNHDQNGRAIDCDDEYWRHDAIDLTLTAAPQLSF